MAMMNGLLALMVAVQAGPCPEAAQKAAELRKEYDHWAVKHDPVCPLCDGGTPCRDGFERREGAKKALDGWKKLHLVLCKTCQAAVCTVPETTWSLMLADLKLRHRSKCDKRCDGDENGCDLLRPQVAELKKKYEEWKREHPALCDKCAPACDDWRKRAADLDAKADDVYKKHVDKCFDCKSALACERSARMTADRKKDRLALWKAHLASCRCWKTDLSK
jgi:hypothetical protein